MAYASSVRVLLLAGVLALGGFACDGPRVMSPPPDAGGADSGTNAGQDFGIPWLPDGAPTFTSSDRTCPEGYHETRTETGVLVCDPWPSGPLPGCEGAAARFPGDPACVSIGSSCPAGEWPEGLPSGKPIVYVNDDARPGGDGTLSRPYRDVLMAVDRSPTGAVVAVAKGTYNGRIDLFNEVTVWGACVAETRLTSSGVGEGEVVVGALRGDTVALKNLSIGSAGAIGVFVQGGTTLTVTDVVVDSAAGFGLYVTGLGSFAELENVVIRNVAQFLSRNGGVGIQVVDDGRAVIRNSAVEDVVDTHIVAATRADITLENVSCVRALGGVADSHQGTAVSVQEDSRAVIRGLAVQGAAAAGLNVARGSTVTATDLYFQDLGASNQNAAAPAVEVRLNSTVDVTGLHIVDGRGVAIAGQENGQLIATDVLVDNVRPSESETDPSGRALTARDTSVFRISRAVFQNSRRTAVLTRDDATVELTDVMVRETQPSGPRNLGVGIALFAAQHRLERVVIDGSTLVGLAVSGENARAELIDVVIRDVRTDPVDGEGGRALTADLGAHVTGQRLLVERSREMGLFIIDPGTEVRLSNVVVRDILGEECGDTCSLGPLGYGAGVLDESLLELRDFQIARPRLLGILVADGASLSGSDGEISECPVGINSQNTLFDPALLTNVTFNDVGRRLDVETLPVPDPLRDL